MAQNTNTFHFLPSNTSIITRLEKSSWAQSVSSINVYHSWINMLPMSMLTVHVQHKFNSNANTLGFQYVLWELFSRRQLFPPMYSYIWVMSCYQNHSEYKNSKTDMTLNIVYWYDVMKFSLPSKYFNQSFMKCNWRRIHFCKCVSLEK